MGSYVVKTDDICGVIRQMEELKGPGTIEYKPDLLNHLKEDEYRRIKWFFYCDNIRGNTIRVFDSQFQEKYGRKKKDVLLLEGKEIGEEGEPPKSDMLQLFSERKEGYPRYVTFNGTPETFDYFEQLNSNANDAEDEVLSVNAANEQLDENLARYQTLVDKTFLNHSFFSSLERLLSEHMQLILEGPPGSGKTFVARKFAEWWTNPQASGAGPGSAWKVVQFHESYGYEDFFQGIRPQLLDAHGKEIKPSDTTSPVEKMVYRNSSGIFYKLCEDAAKAKAPDVRFVLVIDEINRGKASRIFGELLYLLEYRDEKIQLASGEENFGVPDNLYIIGTMNTSDRSIALVDYALRRRFKFVDLQPYEKVGLPPDEKEDAPVLRSWLEAKSISNVDEIVTRFCKLNTETSRINPHFIVGHSYFMPHQLESRKRESAPKPFPKDLLEEIWKFSILPLLSEYEPHRSRDELTTAYRHLLLVPLSG